MKKFISLVLCAMLILSCVAIASAAKVDVENGLLDPAGSFMAKGGRLGHEGSYTAKIGFNKWNADNYGCGDTVFVTRTEGKTTIGEAMDVANGQYNLNWWRVMVVEYDNTDGNCCYKVKEIHAPGDATSDAKAALVIPEGGFAVVIHNLETFEPEDKRENIDISAMSTANCAAFDQYAVGDKVDIMGVPSPLLPEFGIYELTTAPTLDGEIRAGEYGDAVMEINPENPLCDYFMFGADKYATGKFYATYVGDTLYLAWDIASEHYKYLGNTTGEGNMWQTDCIQINIGALSTYDEHMLNATAQPWGTLAAGYDCMIQLGISVREDGTTALCQNGTWMGNNKCAMEGSAKRDDTLGKTVYEVAIKSSDISNAFANYDVNFEEGTEFALSFSINTDDGSQKVLRLRDGGSIFGRNDYSKAPNAVLLGAKQTPPETSEPATEPTEPTTPNTGDSTMVFALIALVAMAGAVVVTKKAR